MNRLPLFEKATKDFGFRSNPDSKLTLFYLYLYISCVVLFFFVLLFRLFQLSVVKGNYYRRLSDENRIREVIIEAKRGEIVDRRGFVVVKNQQIDLEKKDERLTSKREYQTPETIAHIVGYRQVADSSDLKNDRCLNKLKLGDKVGKKGIEKIFECELRGTRGKKLIELDAAGKALRTLSVLPAQDGKSLRLSFDWELQQKAYGLLSPSSDKQNKGAVVALKPKTGEILAMVSSPSFNPQDFEDANTEKVQRYIKNDNKPLFNRVTEGTYPPGSIFKIVVATGALEEKKIDEETEFEDTGEIKAGPLTFGNWYFLQYGKTEGMLNITKALRRSNDIFFYRVSEKLGPEEIKKWALKFGFGKKNSLLFDQAEGLIPSPFWKEDALKDRWYLGDSYNLSIGQGYLSTTPLQVALSTSVFATNGLLCEPKLLKDERSSCKSLKISKKTLDIVKEGMRQACSTGGTGWPFFEFKVNNSELKVGCKTGTAENHGASKIPHAWFTVFAPFDNPEIVVTVLVEESGQGSDIAAPIAKEIVKTYLERKE